LPKKVLLDLQRIRSENVRGLKADSCGKESELRRIQRTYFQALEEILDSREGYLSNPQIARIVTESLKFFEGERYRLDAWVVMPTHVHAVLWPAPGHTLSEILHSWKRFSAHEANKLLGRLNERFWQPESYDHWIRARDEHRRCCLYTLNNPVKAGLCQSPEQWPWSSASSNADF